MQQINLYSQLDHYIEPPLSARKQLWLLLAIAAVLLAAYLWLLAAEGSLRGELLARQQQFQQLQAQQQSLAAKKQQLMDDSTLARELERLRRDIEFRRLLLNSISPQQLQSGVGFAAHLQALARQHIDGLWFTEIDLLDGGQHLALRGQLRKPEYLPRYLQRLGSEPSFAGQKFSVLRMHSNAQNKALLDFEVGVREQETSGEYR